MRPMTIDQTKGNRGDEDPRLTSAGYSIELGIGERGRAGMARLELMLNDVLERMTAVEEPQTREG
jgi:hypothetical protein